MMEFLALYSSEEPNLALKMGGLHDEGGHGTVSLGRGPTVL